MKVVYLGTDAFLPCFRYMLERHEVMALFSCGNQEDYFRAEGITKMAREQGIPVHGEPLSEGMARSYIEEGCELFCSADYGRKIPMLPEEDGFRAVNVHAALLPEGRSYCPVECAMERGLSRTGVTIHKLAEVFDTGAILAQAEVEIGAEDDSVAVYLKCAEKALQLMEKVMDAFPEDYVKARPQTERLPFWRLQHFDEARLSHGLTVAEAVRRYRIYNRMLRVKRGDEVYYVDSLIAGHDAISEDYELDESRMVYRLRDGHARLQLVPAEGGEELWQAKSYPFSRQRSSKL